MEPTIDLEGLQKVVGAPPPRYKKGDARNSRRESWWNACQQALKDLLLSEDIQKLSADAENNKRLARANHDLHLRLLRRISGPICRLCGCGGELASGLRPTCSGRRGCKCLCHRGVK